MVTTWGKQFKVQLLVLHAQLLSLVSLLHFLFMLLPLSTSIFFFVVVPHVTDAIQDWVERVAFEPVEKKIKADVCIIEVRMEFEFFLYSEKWWPTPGLFHSSASIKKLLKMLIDLFG